MARETATAYGNFVGGEWVEAVEGDHGCAQPGERMTMLLKMADILDEHADCTQIKHVMAKID
jgi:hypothetical protein